MPWVVSVWEWQDDFKEHWVPWSYKYRSYWHYHMFFSDPGITRWSVSKQSGPDDKFSESFPFQAPHFRVLHVVNSRWLPHERSACVGKHPQHQGLHRIANDTVKFKGCLKRKVDLDEENDLFSVKPVCYQLINSHQRSSPGWQWWWQILGPGYAKTAGAGGFVDVPNMSQTFKHVLHSWLTFLVNHWWNYWG